LVPLASGCGYSPPKEHPRQNIEYIDMLYDWLQTPQYLFCSQSCSLPLYFLAQLTWVVSQAYTLPLSPLSKDPFRHVICKKAS
jgi:hypothetical protein